jgi:hypothetical protein
MLRDPRLDPRKRAAIAAIEQRGRQLGLIMNSPEILRQASCEVINRAKAFKPIDEEVTLDRMAVALRNSWSAIRPKFGGGSLISTGADAPLTAAGSSITLHGNKGYFHEENTPH